MFTYRVYLVAVVGVMVVASRFIEVLAKDLESYGDSWDDEIRDLGFRLNQDSFDCDFSTLPQVG